jgi:small subunit ribosomal protein S17
MADEKKKTKKSEAAEAEPVTATAPAPADAVAASEPEPTVEVEAAAVEAPTAEVEAEPTPAKAPAEATAPAAPKRSKAAEPKAAKAAAAKAKAKAKPATPAERKAIVRLPKPENVQGRRQERRGVVVSDAMDKTVVVKVDTIKSHPRYKKVVRRSTKFHAHDESNEAKVGDVVRIIETRPLSKMKRWRLAEVVEAAK